MVISATKLVENWERRREAVVVDQILASHVASNRIILELRLKTSTSVFIMVITISGAKISRPDICQKFAVLIQVYDRKYIPFAMSI